MQNGMPLLWRSSNAGSKKGGGGGGGGDDTLGKTVKNKDENAQRNAKPATDVKGNNNKSSSQNREKSLSTKDAKGGGLFGNLKESSDNVNKILKDTSKATGTITEFMDEVAKKAKALSETIPDWKPFDRKKAEQCDIIQEIASLLYEDFNVHKRIYSIMEMHRDNWMKYFRR